MKKWIMIVTAAMATIVLSGCGGGGYDEGYDDGFHDGTRVPEASMTTLFFRDRDGFSAAGVHYSCVSPDGIVTPDYITAPNGEFTFYPGERCTFSFIGFNGTPDDPLFIEDDIGRGKGDIPYSCYSGDAGVTAPDGSFDYLVDDSCTFYL